MEQRAREPWRLRLSPAKASSGRESSGMVPWWKAHSGMGMLLVRESLKMELYKMELLEKQPSWSGPPWMDLPEFDLPVPTLSVSEG
jgi:hypothetical protein